MVSCDHLQKRLQVSLHHSQENLVILGYLSLSHFKEETSRLHKSLFMMILANLRANVFFLPWPFILSVSRVVCGLLVA